MNAGAFAAAGIRATVGRLFGDNEQAIAVVRDGFAARNFGGKTLRRHYLHVHLPADGGVLAVVQEITDPQFIFVGRV